MDRQEELHDPDYPQAQAGAPEEAPGASEEGKVEKIKRIIRREFTNELEARENDIMLIDQRCVTARRLLQRLRYVVVNNYYGEERLKLTAGQIQDEVAAQSEPRARAAVSSVLREGQRRLHPSVRKLLGKQSSPVELHEILVRSRAPRNKARKNYSAMVQSRNYTIPAAAGHSLRPPAADPAADPAQLEDPEPSSSKPAKLPRRITPKLTNVLTLDEATRNQTKHRYRIIIGNTSKYAPPASAADRSTHKWLLYVRGPAARPDLSAVVTAVTVRLHHSYAPHHTVHIDKPPFHVSRRGWGEFPARVELQFAAPHRNRPAALMHTIKLDRNYTGFQTLGAETVVDVWLYSTEEMLPYEFKETTKDCIKAEPVDLEPKAELDTQPEHIFENHDKQTDNWLDFFSNTTELDVDEMIIKPQKPLDKPDLENEIETNIIPKESSDERLQDSIELQANIKEEPIDSQEESEDHWKNVENVNCKNEPEDLPNQLLSQPNSPKKRIMKYMDPTTGKIYYLEMDRKLDLTKVQEIIISSKGNVKTAKISPIKPNGLKNVRKQKKGGVSLLKPEIKSLLKNETVKTQQKSVLKRKYAHIENDHCYLGTVLYQKSIQSATEMNYFEEVETVKKEESLFDNLCSAIVRLFSVKVAVDYCLRKVLLVNSEARDPEFLRSFPFVVETEEKYWKLDFAKRRNMEWSRAKLINKLLTEYLNTSEPIWRTKQILIYSRLHGYYPVRPDTISKPSNDTEWSSWTDLENCRNIESSIREDYPNASDISTLTRFNPESFTQTECIDLHESDEEIEIVKWDDRVTVKKEVLPDSTSDLPVLPVEDPQERLRFMFVEQTCAEIGIELRNEDIGHGYSYSAVHAVLLSAARSLAGELLRGARTASLTPLAQLAPLGSAWPGSSSRTPVGLQHVYRGARSPRLHALTSRCLGAAAKHMETL